MKTNALLFAAALALVLLSACDSTEDPNLLNPPAPDSTGVRVINLLPTESVDVFFPVATVVDDLRPLEASPFKNVWILEQTLLMLKRSNREFPDTLFSQTLARGTKVDYFVLGGLDTTVRIIRLGLGDQEKQDLIAHKQRKLTFINAIPDTSTYYIKIGCQSGDTVFTPQQFSQAPLSNTFTQDEVSLYLFSSADPTTPVASVRVPLASGGVGIPSTYLVAGIRNGQRKLFVVPSESGSGPLNEAMPEVRTTASVELLNALPSGKRVSAQLDGSSSPIANNVASLTISAPAEIDACVNSLGDSIVITADGAAPFKTPIRLSVGGRALIVVSGDPAQPQALVLDRTLPQSAGDTAYVRGVNVSRTITAASISIGAGAPEVIPADSRPFGTLRTLIATGWIPLPAGSYPLMLSNAANGAYVQGGIQRLDPGFYTVIVADDPTGTGIYVVRDDITGSALTAIPSQGIRATFFNMMPDMDATFSIGGQSPRALPYGYVQSTVLPFTTTSITSNAGSITVDPTLPGLYMIGATGDAGGRSVIALRTPLGPIGARQASVRFLNAVPGSPEMTVHLDDSTSPAIATLPFGVVSPEREIEARQYSVLIKTVGDTIVKARTDGVQITQGRRYLLVVGPKRNGSTSALAYQTLWIQE